MSKEKQMIDAEEPVVASVRKEESMEAFVEENPQYTYIFMYDTGKRIYGALTGSGDCKNRFLVETLEEAVALAKKMTAPGKACAMSPAAPSYGVFKNFEERGKYFKDIVKTKPGITGYCQVSGRSGRASKNGEVVIIPTDTVYGFSGIVDENFFTDSKIRKIKGREENKPFIQLISSPSEIFNYTNDFIPQKLIDCWPGALTIIVNDKRGGTTAFRCPGDSWLRKIIEKVGKELYESINKELPNAIDKELERLK